MHPESCMTQGSSVRVTSALAPLGFKHREMEGNASNWCHATLRIVVDATGRDLVTRFRTAYRLIVAHVAQDEQPAH